MIYFGGSGTSITFPVFVGASEGDGDPEFVFIFQSDDPLVLENRINALGKQQAIVKGRLLTGIQIAGAGQGAQFTVQMLLSSAVPADLITNNFPQADNVDGLNVFLYKGETEAELNVQKQRALGRARAFVNGFQTPQWRGFECAASQDGRVFMGLFVVYRGDPV